MAGDLKILEILLDFAEKQEHWDKKSLSIMTNVSIVCGISQSAFVSVCPCLLEFLDLSKGILEGEGGIQYLPAVCHKSPQVNSSICLE